MADTNGATFTPREALKKFRPGPKLIFSGLVLIVLWVAVMMSVTYVRPYEFGIKEVKLGVNRGIQKEPVGPGWVFVAPGMANIHKFPRDIQVLDLTHNSAEVAGLDHRVEKSAHIQTSDGFFVDVDVSILYRIVDPYRLITSIGPGTLYIENGIIPRAEPVLKQSLGTLTTEEFYNSPLRTSKVELAKKLLHEELSEKGLEVDQVLIRYFQYSDEIQRNIEEKKLKDQLVFKNQAEKHAASEEAELNKIRQQGEAKITVKLQEGSSYEVGRRADQELYSRKQRAEADLLVKIAEAHRQELKNAALQGTGSSRMVGLKMAEALDGLKLVVLPSDGAGGFNPLNLRETLKLFDVNEGGTR